MKNRYPENWPDIALKVKQAARWRCQECGLKCIEPGQKTKGLSRSEIAKHRLAVHHQNYKPEDNRPENLIALCSACHCAKHQGRRGSITIGQLELIS
ncbi:HNH endonuclease (plasmid) [Picosynechococcus sp. PCC 11901]|uniref:HNH endonuclease n=1 Tax=unclassified Picosynechococcus TaxID=3079910 RepID=UPI0009074A8B|nr:MULTISPECIES: HNH endonuclease [unclassified Picosynechococcus]QCS48126.1 HNH endonuclease [Picosynechococcus sp. PCC 11901]